MAQRLFFSFNKTIHKTSVKFLRTSAQPLASGIEIKTEIPGYQFITVQHVYMKQFCIREVS